ncbi:unnamed protein product [Rangifer tarandus platyrhynchus]|uniref:Uncharacterized protein n=2 Tax=Rangifer tarandus platyrhynchus TaxID=3082113 RepID=A0ABN8YEP5_RANTA|nr:unnamed protein product [Rangifer tarandus platyrhynchus]CAI9700300.1 unnamed protein product [Rangifer tarandus platyrhynchus]
MIGGRKSRGSPGTASPLTEPPRLLQNTGLWLQNPGSWASPGASASPSTDRRGYLGQLHLRWAPLIRLAATPATGPLTRDTGILAVTSPL